LNVTLERLPESQIQLDIAADEQEFAKAVNRAYTRAAKDVRIPGFRPGKAPRQLVEQYVDRNFLVSEAGQSMMDKLYRDALRQEDIQPIGDPSVEITATEPIAFRVVVPVYPTIDPGDYTSVRVDTIDASINDEDVEEALELLRKNNSEWEDVEAGADRVPAEGEQVEIDLAVTENGEQFQEPVQGATFILGESNIFDGLREQLEKMHVGETAEFDLTFAEDDETVSPAIRGKTLHYTATLNGIKTLKLADLNDELAAKASNGAVETVEALRETLRNDLHREKTANSRTTVVNEAINRIAEGASIELPPVMIDESLDDEIKQLRMRLSQSRETLESYLRANGQTEEEMRAEMRPEAARRLRNTLVIQEIARRENIVVTDQDILAEIETVAGTSANAEAIRNLYQQDQFRSMLRGDLFERRLTDRIVEIVTEGRGAVTNGWVAPEPVADETADDDATSATAAADANGALPGGDAEGAPDVSVAGDALAPASDAAPDGLAIGIGNAAFDDSNVDLTDTADSIGAATGTTGEGRTESEDEPLAAETPVTEDPASAGTSGGDAGAANPETTQVEARIIDRD
jgi:trigger factor